MTCDNRTRIVSVEFPSFTVLDCIRAACTAHEIRFGTRANRLELGYLEFDIFEREVIRTIGDTYNGVAWGMEIHMLDEWSGIEVSSD